MSDIKSRIQKATDTEARGEITQAIFLYRELEQDFPENALLKYHIGTALLRIGDRDGCYSAYRKSLDLDPQQPKIYSNWASSEAQSGNLREAESLLLKAIVLSPEYAFAWNNLGNVKKEMGHANEAIFSFQRAILIARFFPDAYFNQAALQRGIGKTEKALQLFSVVMEQNPSSSGAYIEAISILIDRNELSRALFLCRKAIAINPSHTALYHQLVYMIQLEVNNDDRAVWMNRYAKLCPVDHEPYLMMASYKIALCDYDAAQKSSDKAVALSPKHPETWLIRGQVLRGLRQFEGAIEAFERSILADQSSHRSHLAKANFLNEFQQYSAALKSASTVIDLNSQEPRGYLEKAYALRGLKCVDVSLRSMKIGICLSPSHEDMLRGLGTLFLDSGNLEYSIWANEKCAYVNPKNVQSRCASVSALMVYRKVNEAKAELDKLKQMDADNVSVRNVQADYELCQGLYDEGWINFEWRWKTQDRQKGKIYHDAPLWRGEPMINKALVVYPEIGYGDFLMFSRYFSLLQETTSNVTLIVPDPLYSLYKSQNYPFPIIRESEPVPYHDLQCPIMSLPLALRNHTRKIPNQTPYLKVDLGQKKRWGEIIGNSSAMRIGLAWSGHQSRDIDLCPARQRSLPLALLSPLIGCYDQFHCIQTEFVDADLPLLLSDKRIVRHHLEIKDFLDTACLIHNMDLIISIDTSVAHLAGALGKETWILLPFSTDYRWEEGARGNDWYPNARLFRQNTPGDWFPVVEQVKSALEEKIRQQQAK